MSAATTALAYINRGWFPVPVPFMQKGPLVKGWQNLRITEESLPQYFNGQVMNIGILLGPASSLVDVDIDCPEAIKLAPQLLPPTGSIFGRAGSQGSHRIYTTSEFTGQKSEKFKDAKGVCLVELRCSSGLQTVFPGSTHESGEVIEWDLDEDPQSVDLPELAVAVRELAAGCLLLRHYPANGSRHDFALSLAGWLLRCGWAVAKLEYFIEVIAEAAGDDEVQDRIRVVADSKAKINRGAKATGWPTFSKIIGEDVAKTIFELLDVNNTPTSNTVARGSVDRPRSKLKLWRPFPITLLPTSIRNFVVEGSKSCGVNVAMYVLPTLASCAAAIGTSRRLKIKNNWLVSCILWGVTIARSGSVKSPPFADATKPLAKRDAGKLRDHEDDLLSHQCDVAIYDEQFRAWKKNALTSGENPPAKPQEPQPDRLLVTDTTIAAIELLLSQNPRGLLLARDELSGWLQSFNCFSGGRGGDVASWIAMYNGLRIVTDRKTGENRLIVCDRASVSIVGTVQPRILRQVLREEYFDSGLAARLLMIMPPNQKRRWNDNELSRDTELIFDHTIGKLLTLQHKVDDFGNELPVDIEFSSEAKKLFIEFFNRHGEVQDETSDGRLAAAYSKLEEIAARLALIFHYIRWSDDDPTLTDPDHIGVEDIRAAITITEWLIHETERVYGLFSNDEGLMLAYELADWVRLRGGTVTIRDLQLRSRIYEDSQDAENALDDLVSRGMGKWDFPQPGPKGGRPSKRFIVAELLDVNNTSHSDSAIGGFVDTPIKENEK